MVNHDAHDPATVALVGTAQWALRHFIDLLEPQDEIMVRTFAPGTRQAIHEGVMRTAERIAVVGAAPSS